MSSPVATWINDGEGYCAKNRDGDSLECPYDADLGWSDGEWILTPKPRPCDPAKMTVRAISISKEGVISAAPAKMSVEEQW
jgi:hypothetical protein